MPLNPKPIARLAGLGAAAVAAGALGSYLLFAVGTRHTPTGGIDSTLASVTWISLAVPVALIAAAHLVFARLLLRWSREP